MKLAPFFSTTPETKSEEFTLSDLLNFLKEPNRKNLSDKNRVKVAKLIFGYVSNNLTDIEEDERRELDRHLNIITFNTLQLNKLLEDLEYDVEDINKIIYLFIFISLDGAADEGLIDLKISLNKNTQFFGENTSVRINKETGTELCLISGNEIGTGTESGNNLNYKFNMNYNLEKLRFVHRNFLRLVITKRIKLPNINFNHGKGEEKKNSFYNSKRKRAILAVGAVTTAVGIFVGTVLSDGKKVEQVEIEPQDTPVLQVKAQDTIHKPGSKLTKRQEVLLSELSKVKSEINGLSEQLELLIQKNEAKTEHLRDLKRKIQTFDNYHERVAGQVGVVLNGINQSTTLYKDNRELEKERVVESTKEKIINKSEDISCSSVTSCLVKRGATLDDILATNSYKQMFNDVNTRRMSKEQVNFYVAQIEKELAGEKSISFDESSLLSQATLKYLGISIGDKGIYENTKHKGMRVIVDSIIGDNIVVKSLENGKKFAVQHENFKARFLGTI